MPITYINIASISVGVGGVSSLSFNSIPQIYSDILLKTSSRTNGTNGTFYVNFNGNNTGTSVLRLFAGSGTLASSTFSNSYFDYGAFNSTTSNSFSNSELYFPNYSLSTNNKVVLADSVIEDNSTSWALFSSSGLKTNTAAITSITIAPVVDTTILQHSTFTLYGIKNS